jgi:DNA-binding NtrC family response regulator
VRELKNACERMAILCRGDELSLDDLPPLPAGAQAEGTVEAEAVGDEWPPLPAGGLSLVDLETRVIERALRFNGGNITRTAAFLRVPRHVLVYRIEKHGIRRNGDV